MGYYFKKRDSKRIFVDLDGEFISYHASYSAFIENMKRHSIYAKIAYHKSVNSFQDKREFLLKLLMPAGRVLYLNCKNIWSQQYAPHSVTEHVTAEIIDPPHEYKRFYQALIQRRN